MEPLRIPKTLRISWSQQQAQKKRIWKLEASLKPQIALASCSYMGGTQVTKFPSSSEHVKVSIHKKRLVNVCTNIIEC